MNTDMRKTLEGYPSYSTEAQFTITLTDSDYTFKEVRQLLSDGNLNFNYGDTSLFDEDGHKIASIECDLEEIGTDAITFDDEDEEEDL